MSQFRDIMKRPLFSPSRRSIPTTTTKPIDAYRLRGIFLSEQSDVGLVERRSDGVVIRLSEGDVVDGWQVVFVNPGAIGLSNSTEVYTMNIERAREDEVLNFEEPISTGFEEELYEASIREDDGNIPWDLDRHSGHADSLAVPPNPRVRSADRRRDMGSAPAVPRQLPPPPRLPRHEPWRQS